VVTQKNLGLITGLLQIQVQQTLADLVHYLEEIEVAMDQPGEQQVFLVNSGHPAQELTTGF
jgi:hypothetical protein